MWQRFSALKIMSLVIHLLAFFCYIIYLNNTQLVLFLSHENNLSIYFFSFALLVRIFCNAAKVANIHPIFLLFKVTFTFQKKLYYFFDWKPFKSDEKCFLFCLTSFHVLKILKFLSQHFGIKGKTAWKTDQKKYFSSKIM